MEVMSWAVSLPSGQEESRTASGMSDDARTARGARSQGDGRWTDSLAWRRQWETVRHCSSDWVS